MKTTQDRVKGKEPSLEGRSKRIQAMIRPSLLKKLDDRAAREHRTLSTMIELILERGVDKD